MKKLILAIGVSFALFTSACKKDKDTAKTTFGKDWTFNGKMNTTLSIDREFEDNIIFEAAGDNTLQFAFYDTLPTKDGVYKVTETSDMDSRSATIILRHESSQVMGVSSTEGKTLKVTVSGGKLQFSCKDITLMTFDMTTGAFGTEKFSVNITE